VIKKLGSGTDSAEISSVVASNGVRLVKGDQERQSSQPKGGMQEELQTVGIDNRGNDSGVDYQQSFPYGPGSPLSFPRISPFQQDGLMTPPPRSVSPFQEGLLSPPGDPQSEPQPYFGDPDSNRPPFAPGGPSSPIENALARLSAAAIHISPAVATASDENINPALLERGNRPPSPPIVPNYQIPGAAVDQALATTPNECQQETGVGRKRSAEPRKTGRITKAPGPKNLGTQKLAGASKKSVERRATMTENEPAQPSARTRKRKLNPDGEEFVKPKKGRRN
jgi:hypothetical protein